MKIKHIFYIAVASISLSSCNDWLDVTPKGQAEAKDLLSNEKGYNSALDGVYYNLSSPTLYGKDLTYGMMDVMAQYWDLSAKTSNDYYKIMNYDFKDAKTIGMFESIWSKMYESISQVNLIIESLEVNRQNIKYSELIEGEAYALRAFIHMELATMYGQVIKTDADLDKSCVAYRTKYDITALKFESMRSLLNKAKIDLDKAKELLKNDPIIGYTRYGDKNTSFLEYHSVLNRRGTRMNIYAVEALTMRLELARLNKTEAFRIAKGLIDTFKESKLFTFGALSDSFADVNCGSEMIFSLYYNLLWKNTHVDFGINLGSVNSNFCITPAHFKIITEDIYGRAPDGAGTDLRLNLWFDKKSAASNYYDFAKLRETTYPGTVKLPYYPEIPLIRLVELYYTACETMIGVDNSLAMSYLNDIREARKLPRMEDELSSEQIKEYLLRDMRKEYIGEGRMYPTYKRMFTSFYVRQGVIISPTDDKFVFTIPDREYEYSPNEKPTL